MKHIVEVVYYILAGLFILLGFGCLLLVIAQLPGTWLMLGFAVGIHLMDDAWFLPEGATSSRGWWAIGIAGALAVVGEIVEFAAGAFGAKVGGGGKRASWGAIIGGLVGAIALTPIIPIPIVGTLIGAIVGCFVGALVGEMTGKQPRTAGQAMKPALGASIGRALGTTGKLIIAVVVWAVLSVGLITA